MAMTAASGPALLILVCFLLVFFYAHFKSLYCSLSLCLLGLFPALKSISLNAFQQFAADTGSDDADSP